MKFLILIKLIFLMTSTSVNSEPLMIAHAGGGYDGVSYTNSIDALNGSFQNGFRYIEMDFSWTNDGQLVCLHDWGKTFKKIFNHKVKKPLSLSAFKRLVEGHQDYRPCTLESLAVWLSNKPEVRIITDIKYDNLKGIRLMINQYPALKQQLIPQFYQPEEYQKLMDLGFSDLIWILYQYKGSKTSVIELSKGMTLLAVSMRARQAKSRTFQKLLMNHRIFVYTVNDDKKKSILIEHYRVSGIYTDFLN